MTPPTTARVDRNPATVGRLPVGFILTMMLVVSLPLASIAHDPDAPEAAAGQGGGKPGSLSEIGAKLSGPALLSSGRRGGGAPRFEAAAQRQVQVDALCEALVLHVDQSDPGTDPASLNL